MTALYTVLAVSDHHPPGTCWAWMDSAERVCGKPEGTEAHLCTQHATVARSRLQRRAEKKAAKVVNPERRRLLEDRLTRNRQRLTHAQSDLNRLTNPGPYDPGMVNLPLKGRVMTDAQLDRWRSLDSRVRQLQAAIALDETRLGRLA